MNAPTRLRSLLVTRLLVSAWLATLAFPAGPASARVMAPDPVVVVVESEFRRTDAAAVREAIAAALGAPVLRLTDPGAVPQAKPGMPGAGYVRTAEVDWPANLQ